MPGPGRRRSRRSPAEWAVRAALALGAAVLGWASVTHSLALALEDNAPARAHALAPGDGAIAARLAETQFTASQAKGPQAAIEALARRAVLADPTAVRAVATLGLQAQLRGDVAGARRLFAYAQRLSRRNLMTQLWAIEDAVGRGDIAGALRQYDIALRTSKAAPDILFPVLASASADPTVRTQLVTTLARKPLWAPSFVTWAAEHNADPRATAALFLDLRRARFPVAPSAMAGAVNALAAKGAVGDAWRLYAATHGGADRRTSRDPLFDGDPATASRFDWQLANDSSVTTSIQRGPRGGVLDFAVPPSNSGTLAQQAQVLPPGAYRIEGHSAAIDQPEASLPYWALTCDDGRELGRVVVPSSSRNGGSFAGQVTVPSGCPSQLLALIARSSDAIGGVSGQIDRIRLQPAR